MSNSIRSYSRRFHCFSLRKAVLILLHLVIFNVSFAGEINVLIPPPTVFSTTDSTICANDLPFIWNGLTFNSAGSQTVTLISSTNEDSLATLNLTVAPLYNIGYNLTICQNQIPFVFSGLTFNGPGVQTAFLNSYLNCDSLVTINVNVIPFIPFAKDTVVCAHEVPFVWNGLTFTQQGSQTAIISSPNNCDIAYTLNLTVIPVQSSITNLSICSTDLPFTWNGLIFNGAGSQTTVLNSSLDCDSTVTLILTVNPILSSTTNITICEGQLPYSWNGLTFFIPGTQTTIISSSTNCDSIVTLNLTALPASYSYNFSTVCADQLPYSWNGLTFTSSTTQTIILTNAIGCDSIISFSLTVTPNTYTNTFMTICESDLPLVWNGLTFIETGIQTAILTNSFGCNFYATLDLVVRPILYSTTDLMICASDLPFSWNGFVLTQAGTQMMNFTSSINCDSIATLNLSINQTVTSTTDLIICEGQLPFSWNGLTFNSAGNQVAILTSSLNCDSLATLNLSVNTTLTSTADLSVCEIKLPFIWNDLVFESAGSQTAVLVSEAACDSLATLNLTVIPIPTAPDVIDSTFYCDTQIIEAIIASAQLGGTLS